MDIQIKKITKQDYQKIFAVAEKTCLKNQYRKMLYI